MTLEPSFNEEGTCMSLGLMDVDCDEIDRIFLPPNAIKKGLTTPISGVALPQGDPFIGSVRSNEQMLKGMPSIYK